MRNSILLFFIVIPSFGMQHAHPLHVSVTEINYDEKDRALEIMTRVFIDDLETAFRRKFNVPDLDILRPKGKTVDEMAREYMAQNLHVSLDGKRQTFNYLGHERDGDAFVFYIEVAKVKKWKVIEVRNSVLTEQFDDQSNLVHVTVHETVRSLRLHKDELSGKISFE